MDEQVTNTTQQAPQSTSAYAPSTIEAKARTDLPEGVYDYTNEINTLYDAQRQAQYQGLENAYNQNLATAEYSKSKISPMVQSQANDLSTQYERNRRNLNMQADLSGLNTGTGSQMQLAENNAYLNSFGKLRASEASALAEADRQIADLEISFKNAVAQALADNDYQRAGALMQEYQRRDAAATAMNEYNKQQKEANAKLLAAYGDFSGYAELFGQDTANAMRDFFLQANPDYAWANGLMDAETYRKLTGGYPAGYTPPSSSSGRYRTPSTTPQTTPYSAEELNGEFPDGFFDDESAVNPDVKNPGAGTLGGSSTHISSFGREMGGSHGSFGGTAIDYGQSSTTKKTSGGGTTR